MVRPPLCQPSYESAISRSSIRAGHQFCVSLRSALQSSTPMRLIACPVVLERSIHLVVNLRFYSSLALFRFSREHSVRSLRNENKKKKNCQIVASTENSVEWNLPLLFVLNSVLSSPSSSLSSLLMSIGTSRICEFGSANLIALPALYKLVSILFIWFPDPAVSYESIREKKNIYYSRKFPQKNATHIHQFNV